MAVRTKRTKTKTAPAQYKYIGVGITIPAARCTESGVLLAGYADTSMVAGDVGYFVADMAKEDPKNWASV